MKLGGHCSEVWSSAAGDDLRRAGDGVPQSNRLQDMLAAGKIAVVMHEGLA